MNAVIIEDEFHSREFLKNVLAELFPDMPLMGTAESVQTGIELIGRTSPDLVFLDIEMQSGTGFDLLQGLPQRNFDVIFTTAYDHYALQAIKFSAVDYLLKPIDLDELTLAVGKVRDRQSRKTGNAALETLLANLKQPESEKQTITLATMDGLEFVPLSHIIRLEAAGAYTTFFLKDGRKIMVSKNLKEYEQLLPSSSFFRPHNSHIVSLNEVKRVLKTDGGSAILNDGSTILISPKKKDEFVRLLMNR